MSDRRNFLKQSAKAGAGITLASLGFTAKSYANIIGANDRVRVGIVGFSEREKHAQMGSTQYALKIFYYNKCEGASQ